MAGSEIPTDFEATFATNESSKFKNFSVRMSNGAMLTGIIYVPNSQYIAGSIGKPLFVGIHGGSCCAYTYDVTPEHTASLYSDLFGVPFIAINRPNYLGSSGWMIDRASSTPKEPHFKAPEGSSYFQEEGRWFHDFLFPALWENFAVPNGCTSLVTTSHSMAVPPTIIASTFYSRSPTSAAYNWAGMVLSGLGEVRTQHSIDVSNKLGTNEYQSSQLPPGLDPALHPPPYYQHDKEELMLGPPGVSDAALRPLIWKQTTPLTIGEVLDLVGTWPAAKQAYKATVKLPVLYGLGEHDWIWVGNRENVDSFCNEFSSSPRVEGALVKGASHAIELAKVGRGWWLRTFGWAVEVAASHAVEKSKAATPE